MNKKTSSFRTHLLLLWENSLITVMVWLLVSEWVYSSNHFWGKEDSCSKKEQLRASLVVQWLRIRLPMPGTRVRALVREDPTCRGATKPVRHSYWACALEPASHSYWAHEPQLLSPRATTTEARVPRARAPQQEKPPQWEACAPQRRAAPARCN